MPRSSRHIPLDLSPTPPPDPRSSRPSLPPARPLVYTLQPTTLLQSQAASLDRVALPKRRPRRPDNFLLVSNLNDNVTADFLRHCLCPRVELRDVRVAGKCLSRGRPGLARLRIPTSADAKRVAKELTGTSICGQRIIVEADHAAKKYDRLLREARNPPKASTPSKETSVTKEPSPPTKPSPFQQPFPFKRPAPANHSLSRPSLQPLPSPPVQPPPLPPPAEPETASAAKPAQMYNSVVQRSRKERKMETEQVREMQPALQLYSVPRRVDGEMLSLHFARFRPLRVVQESDREWVVCFADVDSRNSARLDADTEVCGGRVHFRRIEFPARSRGMERVERRRSHESDVGRSRRRDRKYRSRSSLDVDYASGSRRERERGSRSFHERDYDPNARRERDYECSGRVDRGFDSGRRRERAFESTGRGRKDFEYENRREREYWRQRNRREEDRNTGEHDWAARRERKNNSGWRREREPDGIGMPDKDVMDKTRREGESMLTGNRVDRQNSDVQVTLRDADQQKEPPREKNGFSCRKERKSPLFQKDSQRKGREASIGFQGIENNEEVDASLARENPKPSGVAASVATLGTSAAATLAPSLPAKQLTKEEIDDSVLQLAMDDIIGQMVSQYMRLQTNLITSVGQTIIKEKQDVEALAKAEATKEQQSAKTEEATKPLGEKLVASRQPSDLDMFLGDGCDSDQLPLHAPKRKLVVSASKSKLNPVFNGLHAPKRLHKSEKASCPPQKIPKDPETFREAQDECPQNESPCPARSLRKSRFADAGSARDQLNGEGEESVGEKILRVTPQTEILEPSQGHDDDTDLTLPSEPKLETLSDSDDAIDIRRPQKRSIETEHSQLVLDNSKRRRLRSGSKSIVPKPGRTVSSRGDDKQSNDLFIPKDEMPARSGPFTIPTVKESSHELQIPKSGKLSGRCGSEVTPESSEGVRTPDMGACVDTQRLESNTATLPPTAKKPPQPLPKEVKVVTEEEDPGDCARAVGIRVQEWRERRRSAPDVSKMSIEHVRHGQEKVFSSRDTRRRSRTLRKNISLIDPKHDIVTAENLKARKKPVQYRKSGIHGMGLFACEVIEPGEFILEYIGEVVRSCVADRREMTYTRQGMGDSYMFRLSSGMVVDATHRGCIARFINHSCDPNIIAKFITVDACERIVFYSKKVIKVDEELTYDYKFEFEAEEKKIPCLCAKSTCRKFLN